MIGQIPDSETPMNQNTLFSKASQRSCFRMEIGVGLLIELV